MNINHYHAKATASSQADELEDEIESIQNEIISLSRELVKRMRIIIHCRFKGLKIIGGIVLFALLGIFLYKYVKRK